MMMLSRPTILLITEDLLGGLLADGLTAAGCQVQHRLPDDPTPLPDTAAVDLLIGELRYPVAQHLTRLLTLRQQWAETPPLLLVGAAPTMLPTLEAGVAWMPAPVQRDAVIELADTLLRQHRLARASAAPAPDGGGFPPSRLSVGDSHSGG